MKRGEAEALVEILESDGYEAKVRFNRVLAEWEVIVTGLKAV